jgi:hypothetical protein
MVIHRAEGEIGRETSNKILSEREYRKRILAIARTISKDAEKEVLLWFARADKARRTAKSENEWKAQREQLILELHKMLGRGGTLTIDGKIVYSE